MRKNNKTNKISKKIVPLALATLTTLNTFTFAVASDFSDLTSDHWAYEAITNITERRIMNVNVQNAFRPNSPIDKFETSRILALAAGFEEASEGFISSAVYNNRAFISAVENRFERWNSTVNREVSFLLELEVLTPTDINNFIVTSNNTEELRALSRQEASVFLTRAANLRSQIGSVPSQPFSDNNNIALAARPYVDFLRTHNIITGDGYGNFVPNAAVSRAAMALMLYRTLSLQSQFSAYWPHQAAADSPNNVQLPPIGPSLPSSLPSLPPLPSLTAPPLTGALPSAPSVPTIPNIVTNITGTIYEIDAPSGFLAINLRFLSPAGIENNTILGLGLANSHEIIKDGETVSLSTLYKGDSVSIEIIDGRITKILATARDRSLTAVKTGLIGNVLLVNYEGAVQEIALGQNTIVERAGEGIVNISAFRRGDVIDIVVKDNIATNLFAFGERSTLDGTVTSLTIFEGITTVVLETTDGYRTLYRRGALQGVYASSRIRVQLDSSEILSFSILN